MGVGPPFCCPDAHGRAIVAQVTARSVETVAEIRSTQRRPDLPATALLFRRFSGLFLAAGLIVVLELTGRLPGLDPALLVPVIVLAATAISGLSGGALAGVVGGLYLVLYYSQPAAAAVPGATPRIVAGLAASVFAAWIASVLRERADTVQARAAVQARQSDDMTAFSTRLANEPPESLPTALVAGAAALLEAEMCVLTVLDPPSGRHFVRAAHGGAGSSVGVEVLPGVGITGQAIRERRLIVAGGQADMGSVSRLNQRLRGRSSAQTMAAVAGIQAGRVIATLTVGRAGSTPFSATDRELLEQVGPLVTLAVAGTLARREGEEGSPRDAVTGLYNRAYLDATLEQLMALRRRMTPDQRPPLSMIMFDIDSFGLLNERHGRNVGDQVLRAVATLLRQRFRASDIMARVGADSFFIVLNGAGVDIASEAAAHIRRQVRELNVANASGEPVVVSVSAGCAVFHDGEKPEALFRSVEAALETARWSGPGAVVSI